MVKEMSLTETRRAQVMRGVKEGAVKGVVDRMVDTMVGPVSEAIMPKLKQLNLDPTLLEPAVKAALRFMCIMGTAELIDFFGPMTTKIIPNSNEDVVKDKSMLLAKYMRKYAGERAGEDLVGAAMAVLPMVMTQFADIKTEDLVDLLSEDDEAPAKVAEEPALALKK